MSENPRALAILCAFKEWDTISSFLPKPWPIEAIRLDLAWWRDQAHHPTRPRYLPGRGSLMARWGATERQVRRALRELGPESYSDMRPAPVQPLSSQRPAAVQTDNGTTSTNGEECPAPVQPLSSSCPASVHTRAILPTCLPASLPSEQEHTSPVDPAPPPPRPVNGERHEAWSRVVRYVHLVCRKMGKAEPRLDYSRGIGKQLAARISSHGEHRVVRLLDWYGCGDDKRARYLRDEGYFLDTLLRPTKIDTYLAIADEYYKNDPEPKTPEELYGQADG